MKKKIILTLAFLFIGFIYLHSQANLCGPDNEKIKFNGVAPPPWAIDGLVVDWQTIIGLPTGNNNIPYLSRLFNTSSESIYGSNFFNSDLDNPQPSTDLNFLAFTHDDYNIHFYLRTLGISNSVKSVFYFIDINADQLMNNGEPVIGIQFNANPGPPNMTLYRYVENINEDYSHTGFGNFMQLNSFANGYSIKGNVRRVFSDNSIPSEYQLQPNEKFKAAITENGYGIEFAIPWSYLRNWLTLNNPLNPSKIFTYHVASQKGGGVYQFNKVEDNMGNCCGKLLISGNAAVSIINSSVSTIIQGNTYLFKGILQNQTNLSEFINIRSLVIDNLILNPGIVFNPDEDIKLSYYWDDNNNGMIDQGETENIFKSEGPSSPGTLSYNYVPIGGYGGVILNSYGERSFIIKIVLPTNNAVSSLRLRLDISSLFYLPIYCSDNQGPGGGKGINPVGFDLEVETISILYKVSNQEKININSDDLNKVKIYPNPSKGVINVLISKDLFINEIRVQEIYSGLETRVIKVASNLIHVNNLRPGIYLFQLISDKTGERIFKKVIVL